MADNSFVVKNSVTVTPQPTKPNNPSQGDIYFDSTKNTHSFYANGQWQQLSSKSQIATQATISSSNLTQSVAEAPVIQITGGATDSNITGIAAGPDAKILTILNSSSGNVSISHQSLSETAANRIICPGSSAITIAPSYSAKLMYDSSQSRWVVLSSSAASSGGSGGGVKNYISGSDAEGSLIGTLYNNSSITPPTTPSGTATATLALTSTAGQVIAGNKSFLYTSGGTGNGIYYDFSIDAGDQNTTMIMPFRYKVISGTYTSDDIKIFVLDKVSNTFLSVFNQGIPSTSGFNNYSLSFNTTANTDYRLYIHQTTASSYSVAFEFAINPNQIMYFNQSQSPQKAGFIQEYGGVSDITGWMVCDGRSLLRSAYADLFAIIGTKFGAADSTHFNIPDLRGRFVRGSDNMGTGAAGRDPDTGTRSIPAPGATSSGGNVGTIQGGQNLAHNHTATDSGHTHTLPVSSGTPSSSSVYLDKNGTATNAAIMNTGSASAIISVSSNGGSEARPININLNYLIKLYNDQITQVSTTTLPYQNEIGMIMSGGMTNPPNDFLACDGSSKSTSAYSQLFSVIGYAYGGSGANFNLPNIPSAGLLENPIEFIGYVASNIIGISNATDFTLSIKKDTNGVWNGTQFIVPSAGDYSINTSVVINTTSTSDIVVCVNGTKVALLAEAYSNSTLASGNIILENLNVGDAISFRVNLNDHPNISNYNVSSGLYNSFSIYKIPKPKSLMNSFIRYKAADLPAATITSGSRTSTVTSTSLPTTTISYGGSGVTLGQVTITTSGRPVLVQISPAIGATAFVELNPINTPVHAMAAAINLSANAGTSREFQFKATNTTRFPASFSYIDPSPAAGTTTYQVDFFLLQGISGDQIYTQGMQIQAIEL